MSWLAAFAEMLLLAAVLAIFGWLIGRDVMEALPLTVALTALEMSHRRTSERKA
jgi:hypothetical protein